jgi:hypothetical protein
MVKQPGWTTLEDVASCRAYVTLSLDSIVGSNQTSVTLEARVGTEFQRMMLDVVIGTARLVWSARSVRSVVRRFKVVKEASFKYRSKRQTVLAARLSFCSAGDIERVSQMLLNEKGTMANAYDLENITERDVGPPYAFTYSMTWLEGNGCLFDEAAGCRGVEVV